MERVQQVIEGIVGWHAGRTVFTRLIPPTTLAMICLVAGADIIGGVSPFGAGR